MEGEQQRIDRYAQMLRSLKMELYDRLPASDKKRIDISEKLLKIVKKECKVKVQYIQEFKLTPVDVDHLYGSCFTTVKENMRYLENTYYKEGKTDGQAMLHKRKITKQPLIQQINIPVKHLNLDNIEKCLTDVNFEWQFHSVQDLCRIATHLFNSLPQVGNIDKTKFTTFFSDLSLQYNVVPYHNFTHAMSVMMMFYQLHQQSKLKEFIDNFELFYSLVACICHDFNHEGLNNLYHTKAKSDIGVDYCYLGQLEQMHLSKSLQFLNTKAGYMMGGLKQVERDRARRIITKGILSTDMTRHFRYVEQLRTKIANHHLITEPGKSTTVICQPFQKDKDSDREFLIEIFVHACDIGNPCLNFENYIYWANLVCLEFNDQTRKQQKVGVDVTTLLKFTDISNFFRNQVSFTNAVVLPLWTEISYVFDDLSKYKQQIANNLKLVQENSKKKIVNETSPPKTQRKRTINPQF